MLHLQAAAISDSRVLGGIAGQKVTQIKKFGPLWQKRSDDVTFFWQIALLMQRSVPSYPTEVAATTPDYSRFAGEGFCVRLS
jgi:hypothetical protein